MSIVSTASLTCSKHLYLNLIVELARATVLHACRGDDGVEALQGVCRPFRHVAKIELLLPLFLLRHGCSEGKLQCEVEQHLMKVSSIAFRLDTALYHTYLNKLQQSI